MLRATAAFHAGEGLQSLDSSDILARDEAEILVAGEFRDIAEERAFQKDRSGTQDQMQVLRMGDQRQEDQQRQGVGPPNRVPGRAGFRKRKTREIGDHQEEYQPGDDTRFRRNFA